MTQDSSISVTLTNEETSAFAEKAIAMNINDIIVKICFFIQIKSFHKDNTF